MIVSLFAIGRRHVGLPLKHNHLKAAGGGGVGELLLRSLTNMQNGSPRAIKINNRIYQGSGRRHIRRQHNLPVSTS